MSSQNATNSIANPPPGEWVTDALAYAGRAWPVLPLHNPTGDPARPCSCRRPIKATQPGEKTCDKPAKHPRTPHGQDDATTDTARLKEWAKQIPFANVGIALAPAELIVVGPDSVKWQEEFERRGLPQCPTAQTGGGEGHRHYYMRRPADCAIHRLCKPGEYDILSNGYVVAPPSRHVSGGAYEWIVSPDEFEELPDAPAWVVEMLNAAAATTEKIHTPRQDPAADRPELRDLDWWSGRSVKRKPDGQVDRSASLYFIALELADADLDESAIVRELSDRDQALGYHKFDVRKPGAAASEYQRCARKALAKSYPRLKETSQRTKTEPGSKNGTGAFEEEGPPHPSTDAGLPQVLWRPEGITAAALMEMHFDPIRWAVEDMIAEGLTIFAGGSKTGKSWFALHVAIAVASGGKVLGQFAVTKGEVLYLALEDSQRRLKDRMTSLLLGEAAPANLHLFTDWPPMDQGGLALLKQWLTDHPDTRLVIVDVLEKVRAPRQPGADQYQEDYRVLTALKAPADLHHTSLLVLTHTRKLVAPDPYDMISGSVGITGAADGLIVLMRQRGEPNATMHFLGRDASAESLALRWEDATCMWTCLGKADEHVRSSQRTAILESLARAGEDMTPRDLAEAIGSNPGAVRVMLGEMMKAGEVVRTSRGHYRSPTKPNNPNETHNANSANDANNSSMPKAGSKRPRNVSTASSAVGTNVSSNVSLFPTEANNAQARTESPPGTNVSIVSVLSEERKKDPDSDAVSTPPGGGGLGKCDRCMKLGRWSDHPVEELGPPYPPPPGRPVQYCPLCRVEHAEEIGQ